MILNIAKVDYSLNNDTLENLYFQIDEIIADIMQFGQDNRHQKYNKLILSCEYMYRYFSTYPDK